MNKNAVTKYKYMVGGKPVYHGMVNKEVIVETFVTGVYNYSKGKTTVYGTIQTFETNYVKTDSGETLKVQENILENKPTSTHENHLK